MSSISQIKRHCRRDAGPEVGDDALVAASASQGLLRSAPHVRSTSRARRRFAIISTTFAVERRKLGQDIEASAIEAAGLRFRPVMMPIFPLQRSQVEDARGLKRVPVDHVSEYFGPVRR